NMEATSFILYLKIDNTTDKYILYDIFKLFVIENNQLIKVKAEEHLKQSLLMIKKEDSIYNIEGLFSLNFDLSEKESYDILKLDIDKEHFIKMSKNFILFNEINNYYRTNLFTILYNKIVKFKIEIDIIKNLSSYCVEYFKSLFNNIELD